MTPAENGGYNIGPLSPGERTDYFNKKKWLYVTNNKLAGYVGYRKAIKTPVTADEIHEANKAAWAATEATSVESHSSLGLTGALADAYYHQYNTKDVKSAIRRGRNPLTPEDILLGAGFGQFTDDNGNIITVEKLKEDAYVAKQVIEQIKKNTGLVEDVEELPDDVHTRLTEAVNKLMPSASQETKNARIVQLANKEAKDRYVKEHA